MSKTDIKCERDGVQCRHCETGGTPDSMCAGCDGFEDYDAPPEQTERKHTALPKVYSMRHLVIHTDSASVMVDCNSSDTANKVVRIWNSHDKLVEALTGLLPFHVSTETQLPSEREAYRIAWETARSAITDANAFDRDVYDALVAGGWMFPETPSEVEQAERELEQAPIRVPDHLTSASDVFAKMGQPVVMNDIGK